MASSGFFCSLCSFSSSLGYPAFPFEYDALIFALERISQALFTALLFCVAVLQYPQLGTDFGYQPAIPVGQLQRILLLRQNDP